MLLSNEPSITREVLLALPLLTGAIRYTTNGLTVSARGEETGALPGLGTVFFAFLSVAAVFLEGERWLSGSSFAWTLTGLVVLLSLLMVAPVGDPKLTNFRGASPAVLVLLAAGMAARHDGHRVRCARDRVVIRCLSDGCWRVGTFPAPLARTRGGDRAPAVSPLLRAQLGGRAGFEEDVRWCRLDAVDCGRRAGEHVGRRALPRPPTMLCSSMVNKCRARPAARGGGGLGECWSMGLSVGNSMTAQAMPSALSVPAASSTSAVMRPLVSSAASHPCSARTRPGPIVTRVQAVAHDGRVVASEPDVDRDPDDPPPRAPAVRVSIASAGLRMTRSGTQPQHPDIFEGQVRDPFDPSGEAAQSGDDDDVQAADRRGRSGSVPPPACSRTSLSGGKHGPPAGRETGRDRDQVLFRDADFDMMPGRLARESVQAHGAARVGGGGHHRTAFAEELEDGLAECRAASDGWLARSIAHRSFSGLGLPAVASAKAGIAWCQRLSPSM